MPDKLEAQVANLQQAEARLIKEGTTLLNDWNQPLTFTTVTPAQLEDGWEGGPAYLRVATGILWIEGPMSHDLYHAPRRPQATKCTCPVCHNKHALKR